MCVKLLELSALQQPFLSVSTSHLSKWMTHCFYFCLGNLWRCALTWDSTVPKGWIVQCFWNVKIRISKRLLCIFWRHMTGYGLDSAMQTKLGKRERSCGGNSKESQVWLVGENRRRRQNTELKREIADLWGDAWPNVDYRWLAVVTVLGNFRCSISDL